MVVSSKSCKFWPNRWFFVLFHEMSPFLQLFPEKMTKTPKHGSFVEELQLLGKSMIFRASGRNEPLFPEKLMEMQRHGSLFEKLQSFGQIDDFSCFLTNIATFCNLWLKSSSKHQNMVVCSKKLHSFCQIDEFSCFFTKWGSFCNFLLKSASKRQNMVVFSKSCKFWPNPWVFVLFHEMNHFLQKVPHFVKKHEKSSIWRKLATFPTNYHVLTLWWTLQRKVAESASFSEKTLKIIDWAKTSNFFEQSTMFMRFDELFSKRLQKVLRFVKKHEKSSIWPKLATFWANYHVLAFSWTFQQENAKSASFHEKAREIIDLDKTMQLFGQTFMFLHHDETQVGLNCK